MRYEVPQFIEVEQKIIGPFTWRQFIYIAGGVGALVGTFVMLPFYLFVLIGVPIGILAGMLAFQKVNNRPFANVLEAGFNFFTHNKMYLWSLDAKHKYTIANQPSDVAMPSTPIQQKERPSGNLSALTEKLTEVEMSSSSSK